MPNTAQASATSARAPGRTPLRPSAAREEVRRLSWGLAHHTAREAAAAAPLPAVLRPLADAVGHALAEPLTALTDLPAFDTAAMDGWAVAGAGPWRIRPGLLPAGELGAPLPGGTAHRIATGAPVPAGTTAVLRVEHGFEAEADGLLRSREPLAPGKDIRPRGQECRTGAPLLPAGAPLAPAALGLAAAAGHDRLRVHRRPAVRLLVTGDELVESGIPQAGRVRDALSPALLPALRALGARVLGGGARLLEDSPAPLRAELLAAEPDLFLTTGSTSAGQADLLHGVLAELGARLLVDGVAVRPGHPMLLAELPPRAGTRTSARPRLLVGLPGNPLAALAGLLTLAAPVIRRLAGHADPAPPALLPAATAFPGHPYDTRLSPARMLDGRLEPLPHDGPAMLRGAALADGLAVVPPGGAAAGRRSRCCRCRAEGGAAAAGPRVLPLLG
ncbi:molybdopterin molybdotransferase MoeA [Phaeacidiphilus oryzae]|uniref:molybdopterin molybdotransferase MoeA n=1 Tax=Phaeacidiphilus oryzae TaxID=348818 RepID=UPI000AC41A89|nr:molybdopterin-binding protein [Phaeacidiphilus oryzae]